MHQLFEHDLKDLYYAEGQVLKAVQKMSKETKNDTLREAFEQLSNHAKKDAERLHEVFTMIDQPVRGQKCPGILGIIEEKKEFASEKPTPEILDLFNLTTAVKAKRYEISAYEALIDNAKKHGMTEVMPKLEQNLGEEEESLDRIKSLISNYPTSTAASAM